MILQKLVSEWVVVFFPFVLQLLFQLLLICSEPILLHMDLETNLILCVFLSCGVVLGFQFENRMISFEKIGLAFVVTSCESCDTLFQREIWKYIVSGLPELVDGGWKFCLPFAHVELQIPWEN